MNTSRRYACNKYSWTIPPYIKLLLNHWKWYPCDVPRLISALTVQLTPRCWRFSQVWCQLLLQHWHQTHRFLPTFMRATKRSLFQVKGRTLVTTVCICRTLVTTVCIYIYIFWFIGSHMFFTSIIYSVLRYINGHFGRYVRHHFDDIRWSKKSPTSEVIGHRSGCQ